MFARLGVGAGALNITKWQTKTDVMIWIVGSGCLNKISRDNIRSP